jgi:hypothetical protein
MLVFNSQMYQIHGKLVFRYLRKTAKHGYQLRHVCPSVRPHGTTRFPMNLILEDFSKICWENSISLKSDKNDVYFTWRPIYVFIISRSFLLRMRNVSDTTCRENQTTRTVFSKLFENRTVNEIMWKNIVEGGRTQMTIWLMRIACWIPKATNTFTQVV